MKTQIAFVLGIICIILASCDSQDDTDDIPPPVTKEQAWLYEADAWETESLMWHQMHLSFDSLNVIIENEGVDYEYWDSLELIVSNLDEAIVFANNNSTAFYDSSQYTLRRSITTRKFAKNECYDKWVTRRDSANVHKKSIIFYASYFDNRIWIPQVDSIINKANVAQVAWNMSAEKWHELWLWDKSPTLYQITDNCLVN